MSRRVRRRARSPAGSRWLWPGSSRGSATSTSAGAAPRWRSPLIVDADVPRRACPSRAASTRIEAGQPLTILATFAVYGAGLLNIVARGLLREPGGTILSPTYEYGCAYLLTAGLMNLLLILDACDIATGKKR